MDYTFPKTPHIVFTGGDIRDDLVLDSRDRKQLLKKASFKVQEKIDGNCVGIWYDNDITVHLAHRDGEVGRDDIFFKGLHLWQKRFEDEIFNVCQDRYVLYGEWLYWRHTIKYDKLPSYFIAHDLFDKQTGLFLSTNGLKESLAGTSIVSSNVLYEGKIPSIDFLAELLANKSQYGDDIREGLYLRVDDKQHNLIRTKYVAAEFHERLASGGHWRDKELVRNGLENAIEIAVLGDPKYSQPLYFKSKKRK